MLIPFGKRPTSRLGLTPKESTPYMMMAGSQKVNLYAPAGFHNGFVCSEFPALYIIICIFFVELQPVRYVQFYLLDLPFL